MFRRYISGIFRIILIASIAGSMFFALRSAYSPDELFRLYTYSEAGFFSRVILVQVVACFGVYMIGNAICEFKGQPIGFKVFYIISAIVIVTLNTAMIIDFLRRADKMERIRKDALADTFALSSLFYIIADFFPLFIRKKTKPVNKKSHRFNPDDYKDVLPER